MNVFSHRVDTLNHILIWQALAQLSCINSFPPRQNGHFFADDIFRFIFVNQKFCSLIKISLKFVPQCPIDNNPALFLDYGLAPNKQQAIIWTNAELTTVEYVVLQGKTYQWALLVLAVFMLTPYIGICFSHPDLLNLNVQTPLYILQLGLMYNHV